MEIGGLIVILLMLVLYDHYWIVGNIYGCDESFSSIVNCGLGV